MLARLYRFHLAWEPLAAAALDDEPFFGPRRRAHLLASDLRHLPAGPDAAGTEPLTLPELPTRAAAYGSIYVVEGSTLGGRLIARRVEATLGLQAGAGLSYHTGHGTAGGGMWRAFCARLNAAVGSGRETADAVAAARATFACLAGCLAADPPSHEGGGVTT